MIKINIEGQKIERFRTKYVRNRTILMFKHKRALSSNGNTVGLFQIVLRIWTNYISNKA